MVGISIGFILYRRVATIVVCYVTNTPHPKGGLE